MAEEWFLVEIDLSGDPVVEIWATESGLLSVDEACWPQETPRMGRNRG